MIEDRALFRRWPALMEPLPHLHLADLPTPVQRLDRLSSALNAELWIKRDDRSSRLYGGNKVRKLEFLLADALAAGFHRVWTIGPAGSHHVLALARFSQSVDLSCSAVTFPEYESRHTDTIRRAISASGCDVVHASTWQRFAVDLLRHGPGDAYVIPPGSSSALADLGYLNAGLELSDQIQAGLCPKPDVVVVALGSGGTSTGLMVGLEMGDVSCRLDLVRVTTVLVANRLNLYRQVVDMAHLLNRAWRRTAAGGGPNVPAPFAEAFRRVTGFPSFSHMDGQRDDQRPLQSVRRVRVALVSNQIGPGYAVPTAEGRRAASLLERQEGIELEPTYTAKAFAHVLDLVRRSPRRKPVILFWHTAHQEILKP
ncbi:MAG: pyridoxal-phosphate dependent enzyme [Deltaproteobacteria bacterium]|nr:pyridoxal-phosphate dependent enzyme [Deltaproteobacteria bacterium]